MKTRTPIKKVADRLLPVQVDALKANLNAAKINYKERTTEGRNLIVVYPKSITQRRITAEILR